MARLGGWCGTVLLLASGCLGASADDTLGDRGGGGSPAGAAFGDPVVVDAARRGFEPGLALRPDGSVFVCSPRGLGAGTDLWRSGDGGATFAYAGLAPLSTAPALRSGGGDLGGGDCDLAVGADGRVYLVDLWVAGVSVARSDDAGATWTGVPVSELPPPVDRPWALGGDAGEVMVSGAQVQSFGFEGLGLDAPPAGGIWFARSTDGGRTFLEHRLVAANADRRIGLNGNLAGDGRDVFIIYTDKVADGVLAVRVARSEDRGRSWTPETLAHQPFRPGSCHQVVIFPVVAASAAGVFAAWTLDDPRTGRIDLFFAASRDGGRHWGAPLRVTDRDGTRAYPWLAAGDDGRVALAWYESPAAGRIEYAGGVTGTARLECSWAHMGNAPWYVRYAASGDPLGPAPSFDEGLVQADAVHVGPLNRPYAERLQVAFDGAGRAAVAYVADVDEGRARPMFALQATGAAAQVRGA